MQKSPFLRWSAAALAVLALDHTDVAAQSSSWGLAGGGAWDNTTPNWRANGSGPLVVWSNGSDEALFTGPFTGTRTITVGTGGITAGGLIFRSTGTGNYSIGTGGNTITLNNGASDETITIDDAIAGFSVGNNTITGSPLVFTNNLNLLNNGAFGANTLTIASSLNRSTSGGAIVSGGQGNTTISGAIGNTITGGLSHSGLGVLTLSSGANAFTGGVTVSGGVVAVPSDAALGAASNQVNLGGGGALRFTASSSSSRTFNVNGTAAAPSRLDLTNSVVLTMGGPLVSNAAGTLNYTTSNGTLSTLSIESANPNFLGTLNVGTGGLQVVGNTVVQRFFGSGAGTTLRLQNGGSLASASGIVIGNNSALNITQPTSGAVTTGRLGSVPITLHNGRFNYNTGANGGAAVVENMGALTISGYASISASAAAGPAAGTSITFSGLTRVDNGTLLLRTNPSATGSIGVGGTGVNYFVTGLTPSSGSGTSRDVIPWMAATTTVGSTDPQVLVTYDAVTGIRPLNTTTEVATVTTTLVPGANNRVNTAGSNITVSAPTSIISFSTGTTVNFLGSSQLTVTSGAIANFNNTTFNGPELNFPNGGYLHLGFPVIVQNGSFISGSNGLVVSSLGASSSYQLRLTNNVANTFTGGLFLNGNAQVTFSNNNHLGQTSGGLNAGDITLSGGQLLYVPSGAVTQTLADSGVNRAIRVGEAGGTIGTNTAGAVLQVPGTISGPGQMQFGGGVGANAGGVVELTNSSANTYSGGTVVSAGTLRLSNSNQLGTGSVFLNGGTLQAGSTLNLASAPTVTASSAIDTQANNVTLAGGLAGSGGTNGTSATTLTLTKNGTGALTIAGPSTFAGQVTVSANSGTFAISGNGAMPSLGNVTVNRGSGFTINDSGGAALPNRVGPATNFTFTSGGGAGTETFDLTTNAAGTSLTLGSLTVSGGTVGNVNTLNLSLLDGGSGNHTFTFASLTTISANNVLNLLGTANFGSSSPGGTRLFFNTPPTLVGNILPNVVFTGAGGTGTATYDPVLGVILYVSATGTFLDNINNVGPGSPTATNANFLTNGATTANLGATVQSLTVAGHSVTLVPGVYTAQAGNANAAGDRLVLVGGGLSSNTGASSLGGSSAATLAFGSSASSLANITADTDLTIGANITLLTTGGLTKSGAGTFTINGTNNITGLYTMNGGTLQLNTGANASGVTGLSGTIGIAGGQTLNLFGAGTQTYGGTFNGTGTLSTDATFTGTQVLTGASPLFTGNVAVNGGTLAGGNASAFGPGGGSNTISVAAGGTLGLQGGVAFNSYDTALAGSGATGRAGALDNLSGSNSYSGNIALNGNTTIGASAGSLTLNGALNESGTNTLTFNALTGATITLQTTALNLTSNVIKSGGGTLVLPNLANTVGALSVTGGLVRVSSDNNLGSTANALNLSGGGGLQYGASFALDPSRSITLGAGGGVIDTNSFSVAFANSLAGPGSFTKAGNGTLTLNAAQNYGGSTTVLAGTLTLGGSNLLPANTALTLGNLNVSTTGPVFNLNGFNQTIGSLTLVAPSTSNAGVITLGAGVLTINGSIAFVNNTVDPNNDFPVTITGVGGGSLDLGGQNRALSVVANNNANDLTFSAPLTNGGLTFTGTTATSSQPTLQFNAINTFTGGLTVQAGVVNVSAAGSLGGPTNPLTVNGNGPIGSTVNILSSQTVGGLAGTVSSASATISLGNGASLTVNQSSDSSYAGQLTGTGGLVKAGTGTLTLGNALSTYSGGTQISEGAIAVSSLPTSFAGASTLGMGNVVTYGDVSAATSGTLAYTGATGTFVRDGLLNQGGGGISVTNAATTLTASGLYNGPGTFIKTGPGTLVLDNSLSNYSGGTVVAGGTLSTPLLPSSAGNSTIGQGNVTLGSGANSGTLAYTGTSASFARDVTLAGGGGVLDIVGGGETLTFSGNLGGTAGLTKAGAGTLDVTGAGSVAGPTSVSGGTLRVTGSVDLSASAVSTANTAGATLEVNRSTLTVASLAGGGAAGGNVALGSNNLRIAGSATTTFAGTISGAGGTLTQDGSGRLILTGANTYTGVTTISSGTLQLDGTLAGDILVSGGTLMGAGSTTGAVTLNAAGSFITPGASPGTLTMAALIFNSGTYVAELGTLAAYDQIRTASVTLGAGALLTLDLSSYAGVNGEVYTIIDNLGSNPVSGTFLGLPEGAHIVSGPYDFTISYFGGSGSNDVILTNTTFGAVPEPGTVAAGLLALGACVWRLRRTRGSAR